MKPIGIRVQLTDAHATQGVVLSGDFLALPPQTRVQISRYGWTPEGTDLYLLTEVGRGRRYLVLRSVPVDDSRGAREYTLYQELS